MAGHCLPKDVLINILTRFPVKSLVQFQIVCKYWYEIIRSPSFRAEHYRYTSSCGDGIIIVERRRFVLEDYLISFMPMESCVAAWLEKKIQDAPNELNNLPFQWEDHPRIVGICNGIVCFRNSSTNCFVLWNPLIGELNILPPSAGIQKGEVAMIGFGFDTETMDHKVVKIVDNSHKRENAEHLKQTSLGTFSGQEDDIHTKVEIYNLSNNKWRQIRYSGSGNTAYFSAYGEGLYIQGACHWLGCNNTKNEYILSFNMSSNVSHTTPLPETSDSKCRQWSLLVINESLAAVLYPVHGLENRSRSRREGNSGLQHSFDVWVRSGDHKQISWTKQYVINPLFGVAEPMWFNRNRMLLHNHRGEMIIYDLCTGQYQKLRLDKSHLLSLKIFVYYGSLFTVKTSS